MPNTAKIRELNDAFRASLGGSSGNLMLTQGIARRQDCFQIILEVQKYDDFKADNDPYQEHDFGSFSAGLHTIFWTISYYDLTMMAGSPDPADPSVTTRVLTVMLAEEY